MDTAATGLRSPRVKRRLPEFLAEADLQQALEGNLTIGGSSDARDKALVELLYPLLDPRIRKG